ncbi:MAG TPA: hypothetical protein VKZ53_10215 [Candidatus Angelobacter sp.]|nr:hypothetical protein [Candidatus Angelobacter sp.]
MAETENRRPGAARIHVYPSNGHGTEDLISRRAYSSAGKSVERRAVQIGSAAGHIFAAIRQTPGRLKSLGEQARRSIAARVQDRGSFIGTPIGTSTGTSREERLRQFTEDKPLHVVAAAAVLGIFVGAGIGIWRARRA